MLLDVIQHMELGVVPYVVLLVVPVLGRMSDQCEDVRLMASQCFVKLIRLMPLEVTTSFNLESFLEFRVIRFIEIIEFTLALRKP